MNHLKKGVLALALVAGISGAFAQKFSQKVNTNEAAYDWIRYDQSGNPIGTLDNKTISEVRELTSCQGTAATPCAVPDGPEATVYYF